jgi:3'-5' exoribonuclease
MKSQYVNELKSGHTVKEKFILSKKIFKEKKDGGTYAMLEFTDQTGSIEGIAWDSLTEDLKAISVDDFVFVTGNVSEYNDKLEIVVNSISRVSDDEVDAKDYLPQCEEDITKVMTEVDEFRKKVANPHLKKLLDSFFEDQAFVENFRTAPAAKRVHHAYLGGLAVHTLKVVKLLSSMQKIYVSLNFDLLITGGLLHDIGKINEYVYKKKIDASTKGKMLGHIVIGYEMIVKKIDNIPQFPEDLRLKLLHMVLSHHGKFEWGSPKLPMFPEALILHFMDNLDSKVEMMIEEFRKSKGSQKEWSNYHPFLEREIYLREEE